MLDKHISVQIACEVMSWAAGLALPVLQVFIGTNIGALGVALCIVGATLTLCHRVAVTDGAQRNAFTLGQESVRSIH